MSQVIRPDEYCCFEDDDGARCGGKLGFFIRYIGRGTSANAIVALLKSRKLYIKDEAQKTVLLKMIRANYFITEICRRAKCSINYV